MDEEFEKWLKEDWFTSGEKSWEEYWEKQNMKKRPICSIAADIKEDWKKPYFGAIPYLEAMQSLTRISDCYGLDDAKGIITYFLANAQSWRGSKAREIKAELRSMIK